jgi:mono/diheme cytochrome c family protein
MLYSLRFLKWMTLCLVVGYVAASAQTPTYPGIGRTATDQEIGPWDIAIGPSGKELPPGSATAKEGAQVYAGKCAVCHGPTGTEGQKNGGEGRTAPALVGGQGTLNSNDPLRTVGSYFAYATTAWDFISRAMPRGQEGTLTPDEVYAVTAFLLYRNGIIQETDVMDAKSLPKVQMPNRNGYYPPRPDWRVYQNCKRFLDPATSLESCR